MQYSHSSHVVFQHRYHIVWATKYRHKVLRGDLRLRIRDIIPFLLKISYDIAQY